MNEIQPPQTQAPEPLAPETESIARQRSFADRILGYSVLGSVLINIGWLAWVSNSDLFGSAANLADLKPQLIKIVKPPIVQKPKPKKKEPPPPPPKQKPPPKIKPLKQPPRPRPRPQPRPRQTPTPIKQVAVAHTNNAFAKPTFQEPPPQENTNSGKPVESGSSPVETPNPQPEPKPEPRPEPKPEPRPQPQPQPKPAVIEKPRVVEQPKPRIPDRDVPAIIGSFSDINLPQFDPSSVNTTSVSVTWSVDERGHPSNIKFRPTGNSDVDDAIRSAIQGFRFKPAVHNGVAETVTMEHRFDIG